jgi:RNA polymerase sigma factor (sigma-70 family)
MTDSHGRRIPDLAALYDQYGGALLRVAAYNLAKFRAAHLAPDAINEVFKGLLESPPEEDVLNWESYLVRVVRNKAIDMGKREAGHDRRGQHAANAASVSQQDVFENFETELDLTREIEKVNRVLPTLSDLERAVLLAVYRDGMASTDVAEALLVTPGRVSQLKKQALQHVREGLQSLGGEL